MQSFSVLKPDGTVHILTTWLWMVFDFHCSWKLCRKACGLDQPSDGMFITYRAGTWN